MNRNHLAIFHAVAETGSISRGADRLHISQPAVSKQISELEQTLGVRLLDRFPKGARLTDIGKILADYTHRLASIEGEAERAIDEYRGLKRGRLAIGASTTIGAYLLPRIFADFHLQHPQIELRLEIANTKNVQGYLMDGTIEVALTEGLIETEDLASTVFHQDELVVIAPPHHRLLQQNEVTVKDLCQEPWVMREEGSGTRAVIEKALRKHKSRIQKVISLASSEAIKRAVGCGMGIAIISRLTIPLELKTKTLAIVPVKNLTIHRPLHMQTLRNQSLSNAMTDFLKILHADLKKENEKQ